MEDLWNVQSLNISLEPFIDEKILFESLNKLTAEDRIKKIMHDRIAGDFQN